MANIISKIFGAGSDKELRVYQSRLKELESFANAFAEANDDELRMVSASLRERAAAGESLDDLLPEAFALVREASSRVLGLRHYDVQLIGAMALHGGHVAEMATGEGKTLVAVAAAYLNALSGEPVHVVTANEYLASRDAEWMGPLYRFLGTSVAVVRAGMEPEGRQAAYTCDVVYGTSSEFGFDHLRDNLVLDPAARVQRGHGFAIVDEADSILIDEARTPLVISGPAPSSGGEFLRFAAAVELLNAEEDASVDEKRRDAVATESGLAKVEEELGIRIYDDPSGLPANHLRQALRARFVFKRDVDYIVDGGEVKIVDEFTGRVMEGRRYSDGLHQAIEAKEGITPRRESRTVATTTLQNYFRLYRKLSGMTGTAMTDDRELLDVYKMRVVAVPTNRPVIREDADDLVYRTAEAKYAAVADEVARCHEAGQPVLVGTTSVENSMRVSALLSERGIPHEVLNAVEHEREAAIVAQAGRVGAVTVATNMAGRGTDIHLGGNEAFLVRAYLRELGTTEEYAQDWQLNAARARARNVVENEGYAVRLFGGLRVIGTERHEARRIDNQLRGRAGRQGDPGSSQFFLSLEDDLLRLFGDEKMDKVAQMMLDRGIPDDEPLQDRLVTRAINEAQKQVESMHFAMRKNLLDYDEVIGRQRAAVYTERTAVLEGKDVTALAPEYARDLAAAVVASSCPAGLPSDDWDYGAVDAWTASMAGAGFESSSVEHDEDPSAVEDAVVDFLMDRFKAKRELLGEEAFAALCREVMLRTMDERWVGHLADMDRLKGGINLRAVGRREPLLEFKEESYDAFGEMVSGVYEGFLQTVLRMEVRLEGAPAAQAPAFEVSAAKGEASAPAADFSPITDNPLG